MFHHHHHGLFTCLEASNDPHDHMTLATDDPGWSSDGLDNTLVVLLLYVSCTNVTNSSPTKTE